jgi:hypothetical protein
VSENGRFLVNGEGEPFFWLGDTAWELFHRLDRDEVDRYLEDRAGKGFTVIQAVALAELDGLRTPNAYGHVPLIDLDPTRPDVREGPDNDYWDHVDYVVAKAESLGLFVALLPSWGDKWVLMSWGKGPIVFDEANARVFGEWIGRRYAGRSIVWVMGGDRAIASDTHRAIIAAMATGVRAGDGGAGLMTFHPPGGSGSAEWWHDAPWLDFNMRQNGHGVVYTTYARTLDDYRRTPVKPVLDAEPVYEDHPIAFRSSEYGNSIAADVRRPLYWGLFNGAFGHTYGHHSVWQMWGPGREVVNDAILPWTEALAAPGAGQMRFGRWLMESRPMLTRIPDPELLVERAPTSVWPGAGSYRFVATRDQEGTYAMVYAPIGRGFTVRLDRLSGSTLRAWWFDPRDGSAREFEVFPNDGAERTFTSPSPGELLDWVLVLDDVAAGYPPPGTRRRGRARG